MAPPTGGPKEDVATKDLSEAQRKSLHEALRAAQERKLKERENG